MVQQQKGKGKGKGSYGKGPQKEGKRENEIKRWQIQSEGKRTVGSDEIQGKEKAAQQILYVTSAADMALCS